MIVIRPLLPAILTALLVLLLGWSQRSGAFIPTPFLLLYGCVFMAGWFGGLPAGGVSGALAAAFVGYSASIGFAPFTSAGGLAETLIAMTLCVGTGTAIGYISDERRRLQEIFREYNSVLEGRVEILKGKAAEQALLLEKMLDSMVEGFCVIGPNLRVAAYNRKFVTNLGFPPGFVQLGQPMKKSSGTFSSAGFSQRRKRPGASRNP